MRQPTAGVAPASGASCAISPLAAGTRPDRWAWRSRKCGTAASKTASTLFSAHLAGQT